MPDFFGDLNLDQVIEDILAQKREYDLAPYFYAPLHDGDTIRYRQEVMRDLEDDALLQGLKTFAERMHAARGHARLAANLDYRHHRHGWYLEAIVVYTEAVTHLVRDLARADLRSRALLEFRNTVTDYASSDGFMSLYTETKKLKADLSSIRYCLLIRDNGITVRRYDGEIDYSAEVERTFARFRRDAAENQLSTTFSVAGMSDVEEEILTVVAKMYPSVFRALSDFCERHVDYLNETLNVFDREIQFYISYLEYIAKLRRAGLPFCYPRVSDESKTVYAYGGFDLALAAKRVPDGAEVVLNDFRLDGQERILVVSGPNQGGKTTFARMFGQLHYLARLGCLVPAREAQLYLYDSIFVQFEREERIQNLRGRLQDDLIRVHDILSQATPDSIVLLNEIFTSTTQQDAALLSKEIMQSIAQLDLLCVWVTFIEELASASAKTVSMVSTMRPDNPTFRTYRIVRKSADGLAYAMSIARKHRLTYELLKDRIGR